MADKIKQETGQEVELIRSGGGVFEVFDGSDLIFSKRKVGSFPDEEVIVSTIKSKI